MSNELEKSLEEVINEITSSKDYQEYLQLSKKLKDNEEIKKLIEEIKKIQKELVHKEYNKEDISILEEEYNNKVKLLESYPLYNTFLKRQEKINEKIQYIRAEIQDFFDKI